MVEGPDSGFRVFCSAFCILHFAFSILHFLFPTPPLRSPRLCGEGCAVSPFPPFPPFSAFSASSALKAVPAGCQNVLTNPEFAGYTSGRHTALRTFCIGLCSAGVYPPRPWDIERFARGVNPRATRNALIVGCG